MRSSYCVPGERERERDAHAVRDGADGVAAAKEPDERARCKIFARRRRARRREQSGAFVGHRRRLSARCSRGAQAAWLSIALPHARCSHSRLYTLVVHVVEADLACRRRVRHAFSGDAVCSSSTSADRAAACVAVKRRQPQTHGARMRTGHAPEQHAALQSARRRDQRDRPRRLLRAPPRAAPRADRWLPDTFFPRDVWVVCVRLSDVRCTGERR